MIKSVDLLQIDHVREISFERNGIHRFFAPCTEKPKQKITKFVFRKL